MGKVYPMVTFKREFEIEPQSLAVVLMLRDFKRRHSSVTKVTRALKRRMNQERGAQTTQEPDEMLPLNGNWLPWAGRKRVSDSQSSGLNLSLSHTGLMSV